MQNFTWSKTEKEIARAAFDRAYLRECQAIAEQVRKIMAQPNSPDMVWAVHDFLAKKQKEVQEKYDYRYGKLIFVFARLIIDGWLTEADLEGLAPEKLKLIRGLLEM